MDSGWRPGEKRKEIGNHGLQPHYSLHASLHLLGLLPAITTAASLPAPWAAAWWSLAPHSCCARSSVSHISALTHPVQAAPGNPCHPAQEVNTTTVMSCAEELGTGYMMEQVKPQHSLSSVRPVLVIYGAEVCCPLEVIFFSLTGAMERGIVTFRVGVCSLTRAQAHCFF